MMSPTTRQNELLRFIASYLELNDGVAPTFDEMAKALDLTTKSSIHRLLSGLEERRLIRRQRHRQRCIEIIGAPITASRETVSHKLIDLVLLRFSQSVAEERSLDRRALALEVMRLLP